MKFNERFEELMEEYKTLNCDFKSDDPRETITDVDADGHEKIKEDKMAKPDMEKVKGSNDETGEIKSSIVDGEDGKTTGKEEGEPEKFSDKYDKHMKETKPTMKEEKESDEDDEESDEDDEESDEKED